jgi:membrane protease YdiL (CAAX protease family)
VEVATLACKYRQRALSHREACMSLDQTEALPRRHRRVFAFAIGSILLAAAPAILSALEDEIDRSLHIADAWPEFWTLLAQMEAWWFGAVVLGAVFIGCRSLVNRLRERSRAAWYLTAAAVWWLLLAMAPLVLTGAIVDFRINQRLGNPVIGREVEGVLVVSAALWLVYAILILAFVGGGKLRAQSRIIWYLIGTAICGLLLAVAPVLPLALVEVVYRDLHHVEVSPFKPILLAIWVLWLLFLILFAAFAGARKLLISYAKPESARYLIIVAAGWVLLAMVPGFLMGAIRVIIGNIYGAMLSDELAGQIAVLGFGVVILYAAFKQGRVDGAGDVRAGLGDAPVSNHASVNSLAVAGVVYAVLLNVVFHNVPRGLNPLLIIPGNPAHNLYVFFLGLCVAPLSEELFLRGWMWTALRKNWDVQTTAMLTGGIWLVAHLANSFGAPLILLPVAIILSAARHVGQSVRAPIAIHAMYNLTILLLS